MCWHALDSNINRVGDGRCLEHHCRRVAVMFARDGWSILVESYRLFNIVFHHCSVRIVELSMIPAAFHLLFQLQCMFTSKRTWQKLIELPSSCLVDLFSNRLAHSHSHTHKTGPFAKGWFCHLRGLPGTCCATWPRLGNSYPVDGSWNEQWGQLL